jgi:2,4-dienoyl-CoA reductase-like NADH-dependent reductase (Old Yellow Enzyme family)
MRTSNISEFFLTKNPVEEDTMNRSFTPVRVGRYTLPNRLVMAPMTLGNEGRRLARNVTFAAEGA